MSLSISYSVSVCNEFLEIQRLVQFLLQHKRPQDNIVILYDEANGDPEVENFLRTHSVNNEFMWGKGHFDRDFASWKNKLIDMCNKDFICNLDADEIPHENLIKSLPAVLELKGKNFKVKKITVSPQQRLSLQSHKNRTETWVVVEGKGKFQLNEFGTSISNGNIVVIQPGEQHRISNTSKTKDLVFIEVQYGKCNENDIIRYEDDYNRK